MGAVAETHDPVPLESVARQIAIEPVLKATLPLGTPVVAVTVAE
jgi:hypothetical protein